MVEPFGSDAGTRGNRLRSQVEAAGVENTRLLGKVMFTEYIYPFEVAGAILLVAIIAAISLTMRKPRTQRTPKPDETGQRGTGKAGEAGQHGFGHRAHGKMIELSDVLILAAMYCSASVWRAFSSTGKMSSSC